MIVSSRAFGKLTFDHLKKMGVVLKKARYFISCPGLKITLGELQTNQIKNRILIGNKKYQSLQQLPLF
jgi:predicted DNA-binding helix-hairpin-helix protein